MINNNLKFVTLIFFIILLVALETSAQQNLEMISFVFIAIVAVLINSIKKGGAKTSFVSEPRKIPRIIRGERKFQALFIAVLGGFLLDLYSLLPFGIFFITFSIVFYISNRFILPRLSLVSLINILIAGIIISLIYQAILTLTGYIYYFLNISDINIILDKFYFLDIFWFVIVNSLLITIVLWILFIFNQRVRP